MTFELLFPREFVQALLGFLGAIVIDLVLGIAVALKYKTFDFKKIADFYTSQVIPNVIGWGAANVVLRLAATLNSDLITMISNTGIGVLSATAAIALVASITEKVGQLKAAVPAPAKAVMLTVTLPTIAAPLPEVSAKVASVPAGSSQSVIVSPMKE